MGVNECPVLAFTNYTKEFLLETDASKEGLGAVLSQNQVNGQYHPVTYGSWALTAHEKNYHSTKLEFLALKWVVTEHFKEYLPYQPFLVRADNNPLTYIMTTPNLSATGHQWVGALARFNFQLEYQKGWDNTVADMLSQITTCLSPEAVQSICDGVSLGAAHRVEGHDLAVVEGKYSLEKEVCVATGWVLVEMHVTDWAKIRREDPVLSAVLDWLEAWKKTDLKTLFREHASCVDGWLVWRNCQNFVIHQKALYLHTTPMGESKDLMLFVVPKADQVTALNGCHQDAGLQGHDCTLSLLQEHIWWPGMASQMQQAIRNCTQCLQHKGSLPKAPLHPIVATAPMDLLHVDFTSIETTLEPNQSPRVTNVLVFQDHFTKHMLAYVTPDQTAKTVAKFLYQGYISVFGAPARLLSDRDANFMSSVIEELCRILGIKKLWTMPYHPQANGLVERLHQTIMQMIRKLGEDKKADWLSCLAEIAHTYNTTHSTVMGYSPHYLMFGQRPRLPVDFYFPTIGITEAPMREASAKCVDEYVASMRDRLRTGLWEAQDQSITEACRQKCYYDWKIGAVNLKPGDLVLVKADAFKGKRKNKDRWEEDSWEVVCQIVTNVVSYKVTNKCRMSHILHWNWLLLVASEVGIPLCIGVPHAWDRCTSPTPCKPTSMGGEIEMMPQENIGSAVTQCPASKTSLGWINGKLWLLPWTFTGASTEDGWRPQVMWHGCWCQGEHMHLAEGMKSLPIDAIG